MSGGSWDYFYQKLEDVANRLEESACPLRRAFGYHLQDCATALHAVEWVDSMDWSQDDERGPIEHVLGTSARALELQFLVGDAKELVKKLEEFVKEGEET